MDVDKVSGYGAHDGFEAKREFFIRGTEPAGEDPVHKRINCNGKTYEYFYFKEEDPFAVGGRNKWQEGILNWLKDQADPRYHPPTDGCGVLDGVIIDVHEPNDQARVDTKDVKVRLSATAPDPIKKVEFWADDNLKETLIESPWETVIYLNDGYHKLEVRVWDQKNRFASRSLEISVNQNFIKPSPTPTP